MKRAALSLLLVTAGGAAFAQPQSDAAADCATLDQCIAAVLGSAETRRQLPDPVEQRFRHFGDEAADRLVPLLMHPDFHVRESAALALRMVPRIDPKHLPALAHAWRHGDIVNRPNRGNGWMPIPIAKTGTEEALELLWSDFRRDPSEGSNAQVLFALARFGERLRPRVHDEITRCSLTWSDLCTGLIELLGELDGRFPPPVPQVMPQWAVDQLLRLADAPGEEARAAAEDSLARLLHPAAIAPLRRAIAGLRGEEPNFETNLSLSSSLARLGHYGPAARAAGADIIDLLDGEDRYDVRHKAALVLGQIGYVEAADRLIALEPLLEDDWLLAYHAAEGLGRLRSEAARPMLERLARTHWHRGVRNNAERALNMIGDGAFARPTVPGDGTKPDFGDIVIHGPILRGDVDYEGDEPSSWCSLAREEEAIGLSQAPVESLPRRSASTYLRIDEPRRGQVERLRARYPWIKRQWRVTGFAPWHGGALVAIEAADSASGLFFLTPGKAPELVLPGRIAFMFRFGERFHSAIRQVRHSVTFGEIVTIGGATPRVVRRTLLPAPPHRLGLSPEPAVVIEFGGAVAMREDGSLTDAGALSSCSEEP